MLNEALTKPVVDAAAKDAIFSTAIILNTISMASVRTLSPEESWPMLDTAEDFQWITINRDAIVLVPLTQPWRPESMYSITFGEYSNGPSKFNDQRSGTDGMPLRLCDLFDIDASTNVTNNPYHSALRYLVPLFDLREDENPSAQCVRFLVPIRPDFIELLKGRDHRAILLFAFYYSVVIPRNLWQWSLRAKVECTSICMYLDRESRDPRIKSLLEIPAKACGYRLKNPVLLSDGLPVGHLIPCEVM